VVYRLRLWRGRAGERRSFTWTDYRDLIVLVHRQLGAPLVWIRDNLNVRFTAQLSAFIAENQQWLTVFQLPACAPGLHPVEGVWSLVKRSLANFAAANLDHLVRVVKRKLKKIQYRPHLLDGCLAETGLTIEMP
jgi:transposase